MNLSPEQLAAVQRGGQDVCCVAGPGSGKTTVLVERFVWLVGQGMDAQQILAVTFTEKAAISIKKKLLERFKGREDIRRTIERAPVFTIHGFCNSLLKEHALAAGVDPEFRVLDDLEARTERHLAMDTVLDRYALNRRQDLRALFENWSAWDPRKALLEMHDAFRTSGGIWPRPSGRSPELVLAELTAEMESSIREAIAVAPSKTEAQLRRLETMRDWIESKGETEEIDWVRAFKVSTAGRRSNDTWHEPIEAAREIQARIPSWYAAVKFAPQVTLLRDIFDAFGEEYARRKRALAGLDFSDLEELALALLKRDDEVRAETAKRFEAILMDELQDTNPVQWEIASLIRREGRFFAVGDVNQSIYGFRYADPKLFQEFESSFKAAGHEVERLEANYRSRPEILQAASRVAKLCPGIRPHELIAGKTDFAEKSIPSVEVQVYVPGEDEDSREAEWLASRLAELRTGLGLRWKDIAVLARRAVTLAQVETALTAAGIPYVLTGGGNFFEQQEIRDLLNWLRVLHTPADEISLYGVLRSPFFNIGDEEMYRLHTQGAWPPAREMSHIESIRAQREETSVATLLALEIDACGYLADGPQAVRANVEKFLDLVRAMENALPGDIAGWLARFDDLRAAGGEANAPTLEDEDAVNLLTIHKAKGLEFKLVALASLQSASRTNNDPLNWTAANGLGATWRLPGDTDATPDPTYLANKDTLREAEKLEEDRLLYVAMTRAEEHLLLSWTKPKRGNGLWSKTVMEAFGIEDVSTPVEPYETCGIRVAVRNGVPPAAAVAGEAQAQKEFVELERLSEEPQASSAIGVTALVHFVECPRRSLLERILGWPSQAVEPATLEGSRSAIDRGTEIHELLAGEDVAMPSEEALGLKRAFDASALGRRAARASRIEREYDFLFHFDGTLLRGSIDLWFEENGETVLADYKTGRTVRAELMEAYHAQLWIYALALERLLGRLPDKAYLALLDRNEIVEVELGEAARKGASAVIADFVKAEKEGRFELRPGERCRYCRFYRSGCDSPWIAEE